MNEQRRAMRPKQPAIPSAPNKGTQQSGSAASMGMKGHVGTGKVCDDCTGTMGRSMKGGKY